MLDAEQDDYKERLDNGNILLFKRNGIYQARVYKGFRRYIYKTLNTRDLAEARRNALRFLHEIEFRRDNQLPLHRKTFKAVIDEYVSLRKQQHERGIVIQTATSKKQETSIYMLRQIQRVKKFWIEYCGDMQIDRVDNTVLQNYIGWRKDYYHRIPESKRPKNARLNPADKTLQWEVTLAKTIIKFAHERGYRGRTQLPTYTFTGKSVLVRPAFTLNDYRVLYRGMRKNITETKNRRHRYMRELLRDYVLILANSGMRVGEANNLKESDLEFFTDDLGRENVAFNVNGKTGRREVIPRINALRPLKRVLKRNDEWRNEWDSNKSKKDKARKKLQQDNWLFRMSDGNKIITLIDQFKALCQKLDISENADGLEYTLYSLRHFYAVQAIRAGKVDIYGIARNMGTSVQMLQQYYLKQATPRSFATKLGG